MIEIDGSEAGGQLVRTAVALSALTGKPMEMKNIRGARPQPGLKTQHMEGIRTIAELCGAEVWGLVLGSKELEFHPKELKPRDITIEISTAGSIGLVLQALLLAMAKTKKTIKINFDGGGTWNKWAPPVEYMNRVFLPLIDHRVEFNMLREGFYPKGGAKVETVVFPFEPKPLEILEKGLLAESFIISIASKSLQKNRVAERQVEAARELLSGTLKDAHIEIEYRDSVSPGSGILIYAITHNSIIGADAIGERGKRAEEVGKEAAKNFLFEFTNGAVDRHASDMLLPYMALAGKGKIKTSQITHHSLTNISVIEKFLPVKFSVEGERGKPGIIRL
ncbi:MAG: RNA 3'-terminal phosphate cyclase [Candidatus Aenigmatarchaeota archaeon]